jgi:hypothetical protein
VLPGTCTEVTTQIPLIFSQQLCCERVTHITIGESRGLKIRLREGDPHNYGGTKGIKDTFYRDSRPIALSRWGDPLVDNALVLLLRGSGYDVRVLPASSLNEPRALEGIRLLLLTPPRPTLSPQQREGLLTALRDTMRDTRIPVLELTTSSSKTREEARDGLWHMVPWPCRIEELEQRIEATSIEKSLR